MLRLDIWILSILPNRQKRNISENTKIGRRLYYQALLHAVMQRRRIDSFIEIARDRTYEKNMTYTRDEIGNKCRKRPFRVPIAVI